MDQINDVQDYVEQATNQRDEIHSQTWNGLHKQSHRWHQLRRLQRYIADWQQHLKLNQNHYRGWKSLIEETAIDHLTVTPLDTECLLLNDSIKMGHCAPPTPRTASTEKSVYSP